MKGHPADSVGWAQLQPPETWEGLWEGWRRTFRIMSALLDQAETVIQLIMSVAWRACSSSCLQRGNLESEKEEPHPRAKQGYSLDLGLPGQGPATARLLQLRATLRRWEDPLLSHTRLTSQGCCWWLGSLWGDGEHPDPHSGPKSPSQLGAPCPGSLTLGNARTAKGWF